MLHLRNLDYPAQSPERNSCDYHLLPALKQNLGGHKFLDDRDVKIGVTPWLVTQDKDSHKQGTENLVPRCIKFFASGEAYVGRKWGSSAIKWNSLLELEQSTQGICILHLFSHLVSCIKKYIARKRRRIILLLTFATERSYFCCFLALQHVS
jgi:hypothetical protein